MTVLRYGLPALLATTLAATPLIAQERPVDRPRRPAQDTARQDTVPQDSAAPRTVHVPVTLGYDPALLSLVFTVGLPGTGEAQLQPVLAVRSVSTTGARDSAVLNRVVRLRGAVTTGASAVLSLGRAWGVRLGAAVTTGTLQPEYAGDGAEALVDAANAAASAGTDVLTLDLETTLRYRLPIQKRLRPYLELGAVVSRWSTDGTPTGPHPLASGITRVAATAGVGGILPLSRRFSARFRLARRLFRTPVTATAAGDTLARGTRQLPWDSRATKFVLISRPAPTTPFADGVHELLGPLRLQAGVSLDLGRIPSAPAGPVAPPDTTSPPGR